jgi:hypothetical protein
MFSDLFLKLHWFLAIRPRSGSLAFDDPSGYQLLPSPRGEFWADPFPVQSQHGTWLFFERYNYLRAKGDIACLQLGDSRVHTALVRPYHLSYPHIFEHSGTLWMIPETTQNRTVELYRCSRFPGQWTLEATLLRDLEASDSTLIYRNGLFWLFASDVQKGTQNHRLHLWHSASLTDGWKPHPSNPVVQSPRGARPGGRIFSAGGALIRPTQDCTRGYGSGLDFRRILHLDPQRYAEEPAGSLLPSQFPGWTGLHTYNQSSDYEAIDGCIPRLDPLGKLEGLAGKSLRALFRSRALPR